MKKKKSSVAQEIGKGLAHVQDWFDSLFKYGFKNIKKVGETETKKEKDENEYVYKTKEVGRGVLKFFGEVGKSFYEKYEEIKKEKKGRK